MALEPIFKQCLVVVRGGGDLGSGVAYRLHRAGFPVVITERAQPLLVRRAVSFGSAIVERTLTVQGITARLVDGDALPAVFAAGEIPVLVDENGDRLRALAPCVVVDARMAKRPLDTTPADAPLVVALGPGYEVGQHCHAVVETNRGHFLGHVFREGHAQPDTGEPGRVNGVTARRVLRAPAEGYVQAEREIGDLVRQGDVVARMGDVPVLAGVDGMVRGVIHSGTFVIAGVKIGDIDPRATRSHCFTFSDKALAVGGGVLEAVLSAAVVRRKLAGVGESP